MEDSVKRVLGRLALFAMAASVLAADQVSKNWALANARPNEPMVLAPWLDPFLNIVYVTNTGTTFGLFQGGNNVFTVIAVVVILAILVFVRRLSGREIVMHLVLGIMLGGALGNLVDRFRFTHVVDFLHFNFWPLKDFPIWNIADLSIVSGVVLLALLTLIEDQRTVHAQATAAAAEARAAGEALAELTAQAPAPADKDA
jgi:signal peptidase II